MPAHESHTADSDTSSTTHRTSAGTSRYVLAIDQGTTSSRAMIFDSQGAVAALAQKEHRQIFPRPGWVEHDADELWRNVVDVITAALDQRGLTRHNIAAIGITNQRETAVVWDRHTGQPVHHAIVWQDTRTQDTIDRLAGQGGVDRYKDKTGLPLATYFTAPKVAWILDHVPGARQRAEAGDLAAGTVDSWLLWNLTGEHLTDVTNASRTLLMDVRTLEWDPQICTDLDVPITMLPAIRSSSEVYARAQNPPALHGVPVASILGDQQAAMFGQGCFDIGDAKCTYGTGNFVLLNTGSDPVVSKHGLLTTICYQTAGSAPVYALEGSIAVSGALVQWLRDNLGVIDHASEVEVAASRVPDNGGVYIVPAFSGLYAPRWRSDARGLVAGLTRFATKDHLCRAALEAVAYQTREVIEALEADSGEKITTLKVDGGMVANDLLMQFQADQLGHAVVRPDLAETTAAGAAYAAGLAVGLWNGISEIRQLGTESCSWYPSSSRSDRDAVYAQWCKAVDRSVDWIETA